MKFTSSRRSNHRKCLGMTQQVWPAQILYRDVRKEMITAMSPFSFSPNVVMAKHSHMDKETQKNSTMLIGYYNKILTSDRYLVISTVFFFTDIAAKIWSTEDIKKKGPCFIFPILLCRNISASTALSRSRFQWKSFVSHLSHWHSEKFKKMLNWISGSFRKPPWGSSLPTKYGFSTHDQNWQPAELVSHAIYFWKWKGYTLKNIFS